MKGQTGPAAGSFWGTQVMQMNLKWLTAVCLTLAVSSGAVEVNKITFQQKGDSRLSEVQLSSQVKLHPGVQYTRESLDADIKRLHATGNFADVTAEVLPSGKDRVDVVFTVFPRPRIEKIQFSGNAKFPSHELGREITLAEGAILNDLALRESIAKLRKFYRERGYRDVVIPPPAVVPGKDGSVTVTIKIEEHLRLKVHDVKFEGATVFSQFDLRHSIATRFSYLNYLPFVNDYLNQGLLDRPELELDKARLRDKYHDAGYLDFKIGKIDLAPLKDDPEYVDVTFHITEGKPYTVGKVEVAGVTVFKHGEAANRVRLKTGDTFSREKEEATARSISSLYETLGYCDVSCRPVRTEDFEKKTVDLKFDVGEGRKYHVRDVIIVGNTATKDKVIRRELAIQPGDPVDRNRIAVSRQRLLGMGYFTKVDAAAVNADALDEKDVRISVQEKDSRYQFRIGAGASDVNSVFGMAEISSDNFDVLNPKDWFYGGGQRLRIRGIYGFENAGLNVDFVEPWLFDLPIRFELSGYMNLTEYDNWDEWRVGGRTSLQRKIFDDFTTVAVGYKFEVVRINDVSCRLKDYFRRNDLDGTFRVSQPSISISRDTRDSLTDPTEGYNVNLFASVTPKALGSSADYYRLEAKGSYYISFFERAIVAMVGARIGTVACFNRNEDVPVFERYFLGGSGSLRGFDYRSVSPTYNRENIGGQSMLLVTSEVTHPIWGPIRGAAFIDIGNAWGNSYSFGFGGINMGAGYGLRIKIPQLNVPIKLDLAYPILNNQDASSDKLRIHFNVGFTF